MAEVVSINDLPTDALPRRERWIHLEACNIDGDWVGFVGDENGGYRLEHAPGRSAAVKAALDLVISLSATLVVAGPTRVPDPDIATYRVWRLQRQGADLKNVVGHPATFVPQDAYAENPGHQVVIFPARRAWTAALDLPNERRVIVQDVTKIAAIRAVLHFVIDQRLPLHIENAPIEFKGGAK